MAGISRSAESDHIYEQIRSEIQHEQSLMNVRVNWLIASQAFLFVPLAIGIDPRQSPRSVAHSLSCFCQRKLPLRNRIKRRPMGQDSMVCDLH
jgi:hypothetical protein